MFTALVLDLYIFGPPGDKPTSPEAIEQKLGTANQHQVSVDVARGTKD